MAINVTAVDNLFTPAPPWLRRQRPELNGYFIQLQTINGDASGGTQLGTMQLPTNMVQKFGWKLIHVSFRGTSMSGDRTLGCAYQVTLPGQAASFRVEWEETLTAYAGLTHRKRSHLDFFVIGLHFPVPFQAPKDIQFTWEDVNIGAGASCVATAIYEQYGIEPYKV